jgi:7-cyano-7-deazaguanine synthase
MRTDVNVPDGVPLVVLFGAGVESTMLVKCFLDEGRTVWPVYQHWGLRWEDCELAHARRFCDVFACERLRPLLEIRHAPGETMAGHWAITGVKIPRAGDPPLSLEIPVRNFTLLRTAASRFPELPELHLVMGTTADNHFSDGSRAFFDDCERRLTKETGRPVRVLTPLIRMNKTQVIREADPQALALSFSCLDPQDGLPCGVCYKCGRRQAAFREAAVPDPTIYANSPR